jgi:hypothetical protein
MIVCSANSLLMYRPMISGKIKLLSAVTAFRPRCISKSRHQQTKKKLFASTNSLLDLHQHEARMPRGPCFAGSYITYEPAIFTTCERPDQTIAPRR